MAVNRGKKFEEAIRASFEKINNVAVTRLIDPQAGYAGVRNICDFIIYKYPRQYYIECKSHYGNTLPFSCITDNQWHGLLKMSKIDGVVAGVIIWFIDHDVTLFVPIQVLQELKDRNAKSFNVRELDPRIIVINGVKKRIFFDYDMNCLFDNSLDKY